MSGEDISEIIKVVSPHHQKKVKIQTLLRDLAGQENNDGSPYDELILAADIIDKLCFEVETWRLEADAYSHALQAEKEAYERYKQLKYEESCRIRGIY